MSASPSNVDRRATRRDAVCAVLERRRPNRIVYAPNYWQWFEHQRTHGLPAEIAHCRSQLDLIRHLGLDVFSRNVYCDQQTCWYGGLCDVVWTDVVCEEHETRDGQDRIFHRVYRTRKGPLSERLRYDFRQSTLVQEKFLIDDPARQLDLFEELLRGRQRANLALIGSLGVDGLEGVAFPTLGDVELDEAMRLAGDRLIITGGISGLEFERLKTRQDVFAYVKDLFARMAPYTHRFILSASCATPFSAPWETLKHFRDAWLEYAQ